MKNFSMTHSALLVSLLQIPRSPLSSIKLFQFHISFVSSHQMAYKECQYTIFELLVLIACESVIYDYCYYVYPLHTTCEYILNFCFMMLDNTKNKSLKERQEFGERHMHSASITIMWRIVAGVPLWFVFLLCYLVCPVPSFYVSVTF